MGERKRKSLFQSLLEIVPGGDIPEEMDVRLSCDGKKISVLFRKIGEVGRLIVGGRSQGEGFHL